MSMEDKGKEAAFDSATRDVLIPVAKFICTTGQDHVSCWVPQMKGSTVSPLL